MNQTPIQVLEEKLKAYQEVLTYPGLTAYYKQLLESKVTEFEAAIQKLKN